MVSSPTTNYGLLLRLATETASRSRSYASSNHTNPDLRPRLVITFSSPVTIHTEWFDAIEAVFQNVNRTPVTTGLLTDYGLLVTNPQKFDGVPSDSNHVAYGDWLKNALQSTQNSSVAFFAKDFSLSCKECNWAEFNLLHIHAC
jgi:hypothetical protein